MAEVPDGEMSDLENRDAHNAKEFLRAHIELANRMTAGWVRPAIKQHLQPAMARHMAPDRSATRPDLMRR